MTEETNTGTATPKGWWTLNKTILTAAGILGLCLLLSAAMVSCSIRKAGSAGKQGRDMRGWQQNRGHGGGGSAPWQRADYREQRGNRGQDFMQQRGQRSGRDGYSRTNRQARPQATPQRGRNDGRGYLFN